METKYIQPEYYKDSFNCPHCNAFSHQIWSEMYRHYRNPKSTENITEVVQGFHISQCYNCKEYSIWHLMPNEALDDPDSHEMIYPTNLSYFPEPNPDLTEDIKEDYSEAGKILKDSPRGTAALLRLCVQKIVNQLVPGNGNINIKISKLVKNGLEPQIQEALDFARVIGGEAVHPGVLDLKDDQETSLSLFETINLIAEKLISRPKRISEAYQKLPSNKLDAIKKRDGK